MESKAHYGDISLTILHCILQLIVMYSMRASPIVSGKFVFVKYIIILDLYNLHDEHVVLL